MHTVEPLKVSLGAEPAWKASQLPAPSPLPAFLTTVEALPEALLAQASECGSHSSPGKMPAVSDSLASQQHFVCREALAVNGCADWKRCLNIVTCSSVMVKTASWAMRHAVSGLAWCAVPA